MNEGLYKISKMEETNSYNLIGYISDNGLLNIGRPRNGSITYIPQACCKHRDGNRPDQCGDYCPLFGETETKIINGTVIIDGKPSDGTKECTVYSIELCDKRILRFISLTDERKEQSKNNEGQEENEKTDTKKED